MSLITVLIFKRWDGSCVGGEKGGGVGGVVGGVDQTGDLREFFGKDSDDAVVEGLAGHRASLTAARHLHVDDVLFQVDQFDVPAMLGKAGQHWLIRTPIVVVSERMAEVCRELGFKTAPRLAAPAGDEAILQAIEAWRAAQNTL